MCVFPPVQLGDIGYATFPEKFTHLKRSEPARVGERADEMTHGPVVEVIVMVVGDENGVDVRKRFKRQSRWYMASWSSELNGRGSVAPDWVGQDADSARPDEKSAVADPGDCEPRIVDIRRSVDWHGWQWNATGCSRPVAGKHPFKKISNSVRL